MIVKRYLKIISKLVVFFRDNLVDLLLSVISIISSVEFLFKSSSGSLRKKGIKGLFGCLFGIKIKIKNKDFAGVLLDFYFFINEFVLGGIG